MRERSDSRRARSLRCSDRSRWSVVSSSRASASVPLMLRRPRASPAERCPPASARDRSRDLRSKTRKPRPTPPSRVNGSLGLALARSTFSLSSAIRPNQRPDSTAPAIPSLSRRDPREAMESFCRFNRPPRHSARLQYLACVPPRPFRDTAHRAACAASFPKPPIRRWSRPAKATAPNALLRTLTDPRSRALHDLPRRDRAPTPSSSSDDLRGWVVPGVFSADPGLAAGCLPPSTRKEPEPFHASHPANRAGDASFTPGRARP
jgi:hypothetical protein